MKVEINMTESDVAIWDSRLPDYEAIDDIHEKLAEQTAFLSDVIVDLARLGLDAVQEALRKEWDR